MIENKILYKPRRRNKDKKAESVCGIKIAVSGLRDKDSRQKKEKEIQEEKLEIFILECSWSK